MFFVAGSLSSSFNLLTNSRIALTSLSGSNVYYYAVHGAAGEEGGG
jgi:hypothetical protein